MFALGKGDADVNRLVTPRSHSIPADSVNLHLDMEAA